MQRNPSLLGTPAAPFPPPEPVLFRPNVAAILRNSTGQILVAERVTVAGSWQFPQGGVDDAETHEEALFREVEEEVGVKPHLINIVSSKGGYSYEFPKGRLKHGIYGGQVQTYYLCEFSGKDADIRLDTDHREFASHRWIMPEDFRLSWVPKFKRPTYIAVFKDFFGIQLV